MIDSPLPLAFESASVTDNYGGGTTLAATHNHRAAEVTGAKVTLEWLEDEQVYAADVTIYGYELTTKGKRDSRQHGSQMLFGMADTEERYNLVKMLIVASASRHGIDLKGIDSVNVQKTWAEYCDNRLRALGFGHLTDEN